MSWPALQFGSPVSADMSHQPMTALPSGYSSTGCTAEFQPLTSSWMSRSWGREEGEGVPTFAEKKKLKKTKKKQEQTKKQDLKNKNLPFKELRLIRMFLFPTGILPTVK